MKQAAAQVASSFASGLTGADDLTNPAAAADPNAPAAPTSAQIYQQQLIRLNSLKRFNAELDALSKKGLSAGQLEDIANAGVATGDPTAAALVGDTAEQIKQLNAVQTAITNNATGIGNTFSTAMYGAGIQAAQGIVDGLKSQDEALAAAMTHLADLLVNQLRTDLKIHSPSQVMHEHGQHIGMGLAHGIASTADLVASSIAGLVGPIAVGGDGASISSTWPVCSPSICAAL